MQQKRATNHDGRAPKNCCVKNTTIWTNLPSKRECQIPLWFAKKMVHCAAAASLPCSCSRDFLEGLNKHIFAAITFVAATFQLFVLVWNQLKKKPTKTPVCVLGHAAEVKLLWTQLCMRMSMYIWSSMWNFFWNFLKFFQKLYSAHIFINCTNLSKFVKFVKIVFDTYLNFIKLSNISKIFWQARIKF